MTPLAAGPVLTRRCGTGRVDLDRHSFPVESDPGGKHSKVGGNSLQNQES
jgi:hypothetical protein